MKTREDQKGLGTNTLVDVKADPEIMNGSGYFFPEGISNQTITGVGNDYAENDAHCCPSLFYRMQVQFKNAQLTTVDKKEIEKPKGF